jgi:hypothetical protein
MKLKSDEQLQVALTTSYTGLSEERKQEILASIRATRPEKLDELHAVFTLPPPQGLSEPERAFYDAAVELSGAEEEMEVGLSPEELAAHNSTPVEAVPPAPVPATDGKPSRRAFAPGGAPTKEPTTNGTGE